MPSVQKRPDCFFAPKKKTREMQILQYDYACPIGQLTPLHLKRTLSAASPCPNSSSISIPPATLSQEAEIHDAMVELYQGHERGIVADGVHKLDGGIDVRWISYYGD